MAPTPIPRFIIQHHVTKIRELLPTSHAALSELVDSLQVLLDREESSVPIVTEVAAIFNTAEQSISRDLTVIYNLASDNYSGSMEVTSSKIPAAREFPWIVARFAGIQTSAPLHTDYPSPESLRLLEDKFGLNSNEMFSFQKQLISMNTQLQLLERMSIILPTVNNIIGEIIGGLVSDKLAELEDISSNIVKRVDFEPTFKTLQAVRRDFEVFLNQAEKDSLQKQSLV